VQRQRWVGTASRNRSPRCRPRTKPLVRRRARRQARSLPRHRVDHVFFEQEEAVAAAHDVRGVVVEAELVRVHVVLQPAGDPARHRGAGEEVGGLRLVRPDEDAAQRGREEVRAQPPAPCRRRETRRGRAAPGGRGRPRARPEAAARPCRSMARWRTACRHWFRLRRGSERDALLLLAPDADDGWGTESRSISERRWKRVKDPPLRLSPRTRG
jgi:hypothetical protein